ncbi:hypothetical protein BD414DRAFT_254422 [Trametes punicea]|nr:hypothetical protein BD414DRAFT_254422 [Trametes punicea]
MSPGGLLYYLDASDFPVCLPLEGHGPAARKGQGFIPAAILYELIGAERPCTQSSTLPSPLEPDRPRIALESVRLASGCEASVHLVFISGRLRHRCFPSPDAQFAFSRACPSILTRWNSVSARFRALKGSREGPYTRFVQRSGANFPSQTRHHVDCNQRTGHDALLEYVTGPAFPPRHRRTPSARGVYCRA